MNHALLTLPDRARRTVARLPIYRVVTLLLAALVVLSFWFAHRGSLDPTIFTTRAMLLSLVVLVGTTVVANAVLAAVTRSTAHHESAVITGLLLWFLHWPADDAWTLQWLAITAALAMASKHLIVHRGRHLFNPAAAGVVLTLVVQELLGLEPIDRIFTTWWVASEPLFWWVVVAAALVLWRTGRLPVGLTFVVVAAGLLVVAVTQAPDALTPTPFGEAVELALVSSPVIFLAGFMLSEPLTLPPRRWQQLVVAVVTALVFAFRPVTALWLDTPIDLWVFSSTQELALLVGNLIGWALWRRGATRLEVTGRRELPDGITELILTPKRSIAFEPGQFLELHVPHRRADLRGSRRMLSIASAPGEPIRVGMRSGSTPSSYKRAARSLDVGTVLTSTGVWGDFVLPRSTDRPVLLVAGGIGVTPYLSMLRADTGHRATLVYGVSGPEVPFLDEIAATGARVVLVSPERPAELPEHWTHVGADRITAHCFGGIDDLDRHVAFVSGPPVMVSAVAADLRGLVAAVRTDHFDGY